MEMNKGIVELMDNFSVGEESEDFTGFIFNGHLSSDLGIIRTSNGDRFDMNLSPDFDNDVVEGKGRDGSLYFGKDFTKKEFSIPFAFDSLTEEKLRELSDVFVGAFEEDELCSLIFCETPYKEWLVSFSSAPVLHFVPFDEYEIDGELHRIYKGEGELSLTAYQLARAPHKYLEEYVAEGYPEEDVVQWSSGSGLREEKGNFDTYSNVDKGFTVGNGGQKATPFKLTFPKDGSEHLITLEPNTSPSQNTLKLKAYGNYDTSDTHIRVNGELCVIEGGTYVQDEETGELSFKPSGRIYNQTIEEGDFFKIPRCDSIKVKVSNVTTAEIEYDLLYY
jgi:hypothetical protein